MLSFSSLQNDVMTIPREISKKFRLDDMIDDVIGEIIKFLHPREARMLRATNTKFLNITVKLCIEGIFNYSCTSVVYQTYSDMLDDPNLFLTPLTYSEVTKYLTNHDRYVDVYSGVMFKPCTKELVYRDMYINHKNGSLLVFVDNKSHLIGAHKFRNNNYLKKIMCTSVIFATPVISDYALDKNCEIKIGNEFLASCQNLMHVDTTGLTNLVSINDGWMNNCDKLINFDPKGLVNLRTVGNYWMHNCKSLTNFSTIGLKKLFSVAQHWMSKCTSLVTFNTTGLITLRFVGKNWMHKCRSLISFSANGLTCLERVGSFWMYGCSSLLELNIIGLKNLHYVGFDWLYDDKFYRIVNRDETVGLENIVSLLNIYCEKYNIVLVSK
jgi:hypothetical protein